MFYFWKFLCLFHSVGEKKGNPALDSGGICQSEIATDCWCERGGREGEYRYSPADNSVLLD